MVALLLYPLRRDHYESWMELAEDILRTRGGYSATLAGLEGILRSGSTHRGPWRKRRKVSHVYQASVEALFERYYPFPLPKYLNAIRSEITKAKRFKGSKELLGVISKIEEAVEDLTAASPISKAGLKYLEYLARHARAICNNNEPSFGDAKQRRESLSTAIEALEQGREIIREAMAKPDAASDYKRLKELDVWLFLNWVVAIGSHVDEDEEPEPTALAATFAKCDVVAEFTKALTDLPHEWRVPYNGLDTASRFAPYSTKLGKPVSDSDLALFYNKLVEFDQAFEDFDFTPGEVLSINQNPGFAYFRTRFAENPHVFASKEKSL